MAGTSLANVIKVTSIPGDEMKLHCIIEFGMRDRRSSAPSREAITCEIRCQAMP